MRLFETSALLGTGLTDLFQHISELMLLQQIPSELGSRKGAEQPYVISTEFVDMDSHSMSMQKSLSMRKDYFTESVVSSQTVDTMS